MPFSHLHLNTLADYLNVSPSSISDQRIASVAINSTGDWIGFGCSGKKSFPLLLLLFLFMFCPFGIFKLQGVIVSVFIILGYLCVSGMGQLLVWEWQSESYVFKQQGHFNNMASLAYSPDGQYIVTGGDDGKVSAPHLPMQHTCIFLSSYAVEESREK